MVTSVKKNGRPCSFSQELANEICEEVKINSNGLLKIADSKPHWPTSRTIYNWLDSHPAFFQQYARAKVIQTELLVDEIHRVIRDSEPEHAAKTRLLVDTIKWQASKLVPKVYGDRVHNDVHMTIKQVDAIEELE